MKLSILLFCLSFVTLTQVQAQVSKNNILFVQLKKMDKVVFEEGFNKCHLEELKNTIHNEFEFYHDIGGIQSKNEFMASMKANICSSPNRKPIRKIVEGSIQVFPLYNQGVLYGAIQNGEHEFWIKEPTKDLYQTGRAKFSTTWLLVDGEWKMKNVLSFDHSPVE